MSTKKHYYVLQRTDGNHEWPHDAVSTSAGSLEGVASDYELTNYRIVRAPDCLVPRRPNDVIPPGYKGWR